MSRVEWRPVKGYEHRFEVSNYGAVRSLPRKNILKPWTDKDGYLHIGPYADGHRLKLSPHRLVARTFLDPVEGKTQVNHLNGIKTDNRPQNLEWTTTRENTIHALGLGLLNPARGSSHYIARLTEEKVSEIRSKYRPRTYSYAMLAKEYGVDWSNIRDIVKRVSWKSV